MREILIGLLDSYGYVVVFFAVAMESMGVPLPGETVLVAAGALAASGHLSIVGVIATAGTGAILGDAAGYWIGRTGGIALVKKYGRKLHLDDAKIHRVQSFFERNGPKTVFFGRFVALLRTYTAVLAGVAHMPYPLFTTYNALGGATWAVTFGSLGFLFGRNLPLLEHYVGQASLAVVLLIALLVGLTLAWQWFKANRVGLAERSAILEAATRLRFPRLSTFVSARFARGEYLGLHLTAGFLVSLAGLWLFGGVTEDVLHGDPLTVFDVTILAQFRAHATPTGDAIFSVVTLLGSTVVLAILGAAGALVFSVRRQWLLLGGWCAAFVGADVISNALKLAIRRPRPPGAIAFLTDPSFSFPSGHALGSLVGYGMLTYVLLSDSNMLLPDTTSDQVRRTWNVAIVAGATLLVLAIGVSRLYLGVHYFSDVVGGYASGSLWLAACVSGLEVARRRRPGAAGPSEPRA